MSIFIFHIANGGCSSVGRALDCGSSGRGFKSRHSPVGCECGGTGRRARLRI